METQPPMDAAHPASQLSVLATEMLWALSQEGDARATDKLFFRVQQRLRAAIRNHPSRPHLPSTHDEEDVFQELWTILFARGSLGRFQDRGPGSLRGYLHVCLDRTILGICRSAGAAKRGGDIPHYTLEEVTPEGGGPPAAEGPGPETMAQWNDWESRCLGFLGGQNREVWRLRFVEDLAYGTIAEKLKITEGAVRSAYHRAIERLHGAGVLEIA